jgi:hypothetical protein
MTVKLSVTTTSTILAVSVGLNGTLNSKSVTTCPVELTLALYTSLEFDTKVSPPTVVSRFYLTQLTSDVMISPLA